MRLALDHHYSVQIAVELRRRGHDVVAAVERGWETEDDERLLLLCETEDRVLLTNNVGDFVVIARSWAVQGRRHAGLIFTSDANMPRGRTTIGRYIGALDSLLVANPGDSFVDRAHWLSDARPGSRSTGRR